MPRTTFRRVPACSSQKRLTCWRGSSRTTSNRRDSRRTTSSRNSSLVEGPRRLTEQNFSRLFIDRRIGVYRRAALVGAHGGGTGLDALEPAVQMRKVVEILTLRFMRHDPRIGSHVGDGISAGDELAVG